MDQYRETLYPYLRPQSRYYKDITLTYHMKDGSEFRRISLQPDSTKELVGDTPAEQRLLDLFNLLEYRTSGNYLYYVEPDCFTESMWSFRTPKRLTPFAGGRRIWRGCPHGGDTGGLH